MTTPTPSDPGAARLDPTEAVEVIRQAVAALPLLTRAAEAHPDLSEDLDAGAEALAAVIVREAAP